MLSVFNLMLRTQLREKRGLTILSPGGRILREIISPFGASGQNSLSPFFAPSSNFVRLGLIVLVAGLSRGQSFEVASVKRNTDSGHNTMTCLPGGERFRVRNMPLLWLLGAAYDIPNRQISGVPEKMATETYDIEAKAERPVNREKMMIMLRTLLEDRFKLVVRRDTKELPAQVLMVAKGGPKIEENRDGAELSMDRVARSKWGFHNMPMSTFANVLAGFVDNTVVDGTALKASYDFTLEFALQLVGPGVREGREPAPDPNGPSLSMGLQQLGLKLESRKGPVELLVVDHIERPAGN
jgi:uncharacterized protein (TIGR03435 family)